MSTRFKFLVWVMCLLALFAPFAQAQEADKPSVWLITIYPFGPALAVEESMLDTLVSYGLFNPDDRTNDRMLGMIESADNSPIQFNRLTANLDLSRLREMVNFALDHEPDALITISEPATIAALQATQDMDNPPAIFFADVYTPYLARIAAASCIKPAHVTGAASALDYEEIVDLLLLQAPDLESFGTLHNSNDAAGTYGAEQLAAAGEARGLTVAQSAVVSFADLALASEGLLSKGVEAIVLPMDYLTLAGLPVISSVAIPAEAPILSASLDGLFLGATLSAGFSQLLEMGDALGLLLATYLAGELDVATTGISELAGDTVVGINLFVAAQMGMSFSEGLQERADMSVTMNMETGLPDVDLISPAAQVAVGQAFFGMPQPLEARQERDSAFLAGLECTEERIAEQQAELDAIEG